MCIVVGFGIVFHGHSKRVLCSRKIETRVKVVWLCLTLAGSGRSSFFYRDSSEVPPDTLLGCSEYK